MAISLASIARTVRNALPPRVIVHGPHGVGKSTLGASAWKPIFLPFEDGLSGIETDAFPVLTSYADTVSALDVLARDQHEFGTVVLDSLDWLEPLVWEQACKKNGWPSIEAPGFGKGYVEANTLWRDLFDRLDTLRARGMAVVCIAHSEIKRFEAPESEAYERYQIKLQRGASAIAQEWADIIGFAQFETAVKKEQIGQNIRARGVATGRRVLHVVEKPAYTAKNRYGMPDTLPLSWDALLGAMSGPAATAPAATESAPAAQPVAA